MKVAVYGCGPAGMFAAHAAAGLGAEVTIFSNPRKSFMRGAQYLHRPIPGLSGDPFEIRYEIVGSIEGYKDKVYGDMSDVKVSPETLLGKARAWDIREAYDRAWDEYSPLIKEWDFNGNHYPTQAANSDLIISTIPARLLCSNSDHSFNSQLIWSTDSLKPRAMFHEPNGDESDNLVICSGETDDWWYRASRIHGWENTEFPFEHKPIQLPSYGVWPVEKPISTDCDCLPGVVRVGRYGAWKKGVLSDEGFYETERLIMTLQRIA